MPGCLFWGVLFLPPSTLGRRALGLAVLLCFIWSLAGPSRSRPAFDQATPAGTVPVELPNEFIEGVLSVPDQVNALGFKPFVELAHLGLTRVNGQGEILPGLAQSWESPDAYRWIFRLDPRARWHDGRPVTAEDVAATIRGVQDPARGRAWRDFWVEIQVIQASDGLVVLDLPRPDSSFPYDARMAILPASDQSGRIGAGPFRLGSWEPGLAIRLEAVSDHWLGAPRLAAYILKQVKDEAEAALALQAGQIHGFAPDWRKGGLGDIIGEGFEVERWPAPAFSLVVWNLGGASGGLDDARVRRALSLAVDRRRLSEHFGGYPSQGPFIPETLFAPETSEVSPESGAGGAGAALPNRVVGLVYEAGRRDRAELAGLLIADLAPLGVSLEPSAVSRDELVKRLESGDFEAALWGWAVGPHPDRHALFHTHGSANYSRYSDSRVDELIEEARIAVNLEARRELLVRLGRLLFEESRYLFLYTPAAEFWYRPPMRGLDPGPFSLRHNAAGWFLDRRK